MTAQAMDGICETCRFFEKIEHYRGSCLRWPPHPRPDSEWAAFPVVQDHWRCGEHAPREGDPS